MNLLRLVIATFIFIASVLNGNAQESDYYGITKIQLPEDVILEVGGMAFTDQGDLGVTTRRGELWLIKKPESAKPEFIRFAHGMHEPLGLVYREGSFYCSQRGELTKITDLDGDERADSYETIYSWPLEGNYHEYSYGPLFTPEGDMLITLNLGWIGRGASLSKWRGWMVKITESGELTPVATGMRSPAGYAYNKNGDIFYTENQGDWVGSGRMTHVEYGDFVGNPEGLKWAGEPGSPLTLKPEDIDETRGLTLYDYSKEIPEIKPPSVWFPHTIMGISTSDLVVIGPKFGPFEGQLLVGDQGQSKIMRVYQEKVNGVYQGICFPFVEGFSSGVLRLRWSPDASKLFVGMTSRGWASTGKEPYGLEVLSYKGKVPFEIKKVNVTESGFRLEFTKAVEKATAENMESYGITDFTYQYHSSYGSPVTDRQTRSITDIRLLPDGKTVELDIDRMRKGYIYEIKTTGVTDSRGGSLLHDFGFYTLNEIPGGGEGPQAFATEDSKAEKAGMASLKNPVEMPADWGGNLDQELEFGTLPGLKFDQEKVTVTKGSKIKLTFNNDDDMLHNLVITSPGQADKTGEAAMKLGLDGEDKQYVPDLPEVLYHTKLLQPEATEIIYFLAPEQPGLYEIVCTFPGHYTVMRAILEVK